MAAFSVVIGNVVADFQLGFSQPREAPTVEQFGLEAVSKRFGMSIVVAVVSPAHALPRQLLSMLDTLNSMPLAIMCFNLIYLCELHSDC